MVRYLRNRAVKSFVRTAGPPGAWVVCFVMRARAGVRAFVGEVAVRM
jgi:hypothetical protein